MDGIPDRLAVVNRMTDTSLPGLAYSTRYMAAKIPMGAANNNVNQTAAATKGVDAIPTPGTVVIRLNGRVEAEITANFTSGDRGITGNGTLGISVAAGTASDLAGNTAPAAGPSTTFIVDNSGTTLSLKSNTTQTARLTLQGVPGVTYRIQVADSLFLSILAIANA